MILASIPSPPKSSYSLVLWCPTPSFPNVLPWDTALPSEPFKNTSPGPAFPGDLFSLRIRRLNRYPEHHSPLKPLRTGSLLGCYQLQTPVQIRAALSHSARPAERQREPGGEQTPALERVQGFPYSPSAASAAPGRPLGRAARLRDTFCTRTYTATAARRMYQP